MIFVTVGVQLPFDRLVRTVDEWAARTERSAVFAQIGASRWKPSYLRWTDFLDPAQHRERMESADVLIAHAGMGSILTALELGKPILIMPRQANLKEHRNDHQIATAKSLREKELVSVAMNETELSHRLETIDGLCGARRIGPQAPNQLIDTILAFLKKTEAEARRETRAGAWRFGWRKGAAK